MKIDRISEKQNKMLMLSVAFVVVFVILFNVYGVYGLESTVCCEKTKTNLYCQNVPADECADSSRQAPTACESTSFCRVGTCYNSVQGTCTDNTPQLVCNANNGTWSQESPAQCSLGCCILGDQAAFVTLTRCKYLSANLGLKTNYDKSISDEVQCVLKVQDQEKGACVYDFEFQRTCKFTTRENCNLGLNGTNSGGEFFGGKLCSAPELGTNCGKTTRTTCIPGKDEVYFSDSCGNPTNIYDASKINDQEYWSNFKTKGESCNPQSGNADSKNCGNCNYLQGSYCRALNAKSEAKPSYGTNICADLNCRTTKNGKSYKHGESWCVYDDSGTKSEGNNAVGSRFYKHICVNGEEVLEQCADFRQEECIESDIPTSVGPFSQAACRVNRWRECTAQTSKLDCDNTDRRDCFWKDDISLGGNKSINGVCLPKNTPGIKFWEGEEAKSICAQGNVQCIVTFEKGIIGGEKCVSNCDCLTDDWKKQRAEICLALGDCGPKINWIGDEGYKSGYNVSVGKVGKGSPSAGK